MDISSMGGLAIGGAVAAIAGFWSQFKNFCRYVSSYLVIQTKFDSQLGKELVNHLKVSWRLAPSGISWFMADMVFLKADKTWRAVPYQLMNPTTIWYKGFSVLVVNVQSDALTVFALRGTKVLDVLHKALAESHSRADNHVSSYNRFAVYDLIGDAAGYNSHDAQPKRGTSISRSEESSDTMPIAASGLLAHNPAIDVCTMFPRSSYELTASPEPMRGLFYPDYVMQHIDDAVRWSNSRSWYADRNIPWRRGWLLHGPGGTGKSSLAKVIAQVLRIPIYRFMLSTMTDQEFMRYWDQMNTPCLPLFEDFDTVFNGRQSTDEHHRLTFDCILNRISGVGTADGIFLVVTTNCIDKIDPALGVESTLTGVSTRPGRIDRVIYLGPAKEAERRKIIGHILRDWPEAIEPLVAASVDATAVQVQEMCVQYAFDRLAKEVIPNA